MKNDEKRRLRQLKREIKKAGNRRRRHFLKDVDASPDDFDFGRDRSDVMNESRSPKTDGPGDSGD
jgi:hypothetical protein